MGKRPSPPCSALGIQHACDERDIGDDLAPQARLPGQEDVDELGERRESLVREQVVAHVEDVRKKV
jgi:hypothetical protein